MGRAKIARLAHAAVGSVLPEGGGNSQYGGGHICNHMRSFLAFLGLTLPR